MFSVTDVMEISEEVVRQRMDLISPDIAREQLLTQLMDFTHQMY